MYIQFKNWQQLDRDLESRITPKDTFVIDLQVAGYARNPYLQGKPQTGGTLLIEMSSGKFMDPEPSSTHHRALLGLGWNRPFGPDHPNYFMVLDPPSSTASQVAHVFVEALQVGLRLEPRQITI